MGFTPIVPWFFEPDKPLCNQLTCYELSYDPLRWAHSFLRSGSWSESMEYCQKRNASLLEINSFEEYQALLEVLRPLSDMSNAVIIFLGSQYSEVSKLIIVVVSTKIVNNGPDSKFDETPPHINPNM